MKKLLGLTLAFAALLVMVGCDGEITLDTPDVDYTVTDTGATLKLSWVEIADADGYYIFADGVAIDTLDDPATITFSATTPAAVYGVQAYAGEDVSGTDEINCAPQVTPGLDVWGNAEPPPNPSGFGFNTSGTAVAYQLSDSTNWPLIDYYIASGTPKQFLSPHHYPYNNEVNTTKNSGSTTFDDIDIADAPGGYTSPTDITNGAVYYFWIDPTNNGWDNSTDYFGKIKIEAIDGEKVTMKIAYQKIAGLRWCVTN